MNFRKIILFSLGVWLFSTIIMYILNLIPFLEKNIYYFTVLWILVLIKLFFLCKWYFRDTEINIKNGFFLGLSASLTTIILGYFISLPILDTNIVNISFYKEGLYLSVLILEIFLFCLYAGFEFDKTFTKK